MTNFFSMGHAPVPDMRRNLLESLKQLENFVCTEASEGELFALNVIREVITNAPKPDIQKATQTVLARRNT